jgi:rod shape-determining protein MreD
MEKLSVRMTPAACTALMVLLAAVPWHLPGISRVMPAFTLINIYYWGMFFPGALPYVFLFFLGLLQDTLVGTPLGLSSLINIVFALLIANRRLFGKMVFTTVWLGFCILVCVPLGLEWFILCIYSAKLLPLSEYGLLWGATCLAYPPLHLLLTRVYRMLKQL